MDNANNKSISQRQSDNRIAKNVNRYIRFPFDAPDALDNNQSTSITKPEIDLVEFMREQWELPLPELIISVTGGAKLFKLTPPRVRRAFQEGLVSAAVTTDHEQLIQQPSQMNNNGSEMQVTMSDQVADYERLYRTRFPTEDEPESCPLDPNHTHFILLDDMYGSDDDDQWRAKNYLVRANLGIRLSFRIQQEARRIWNHGKCI
ncbi:unnamed protein product [Rotaria sordida]|uniref:TRPM SLOG domain-containing protein n=1 Tax=Rotaria sordida TaxID=392033 RepID=A0A818W7F6_9BILA|nr:unnamed protein product [Rotaria sordida]